MASAPSEPRPIVGRIDKAGRLVAADPELQALQQQAGSALGQRLALPQVAAVAELARKLGIPVTRPAVAASADHDIDLWVEAAPEGDEIVLTLQGWTERPPAAPRLTSLLGGSAEAASPETQNEWAADEELRLISLSPELAEHLDVDISEAAGQPLTRAMRLIENEAGEMPLISALAGRRAFADQKACSRTPSNRCVILSGEVVTTSDGRFAGFRGTALIEQSPEPSTAASVAAEFDHALEDVLRSPIDRIIESAERILERADGPLRSDYASYGNDIAAAARHLLSVVRSMSEVPSNGHRTIDLSELAAEAVVMIESLAEERNVTIQPEATSRLAASGQEPAVIQILVNLIGNAVRHSPPGGIVRLGFDRTLATASVTVSDQGPGIEAADQQRIFERFERVEPREGGTGLGLAISRRLARSMGGDVTLESTPGQGARFTLTLPSP
jgi:anti-sigma regulatory factor (Ser/Thr protein kinase)